MAPGRPNLYASVGGVGPTLVLCGHLDTVPAGEGWTLDPFSAVVAAGRVYDRGACDMKAGLAAAAAALLAVKRSGVVLRGSLALHAVIDEEVSSAGARQAAAEHPGDWVIVTEPSGTQVLATDNGQLNFEVVFHGKAVHSSHPEDGRNTIHDAAAFIGLVEKETRRLSAVPLPGIGSATYSVGLVEGGRGGSTVADRCEITLDRRVLPSEDLDAAEDEVQALLGRLGTERPGLSWELSRTVAFPPLRGTNNGRLEKVLNDALVDLGRAVAEERRRMRFATDAPWYEAAGSPSCLRVGRCRGRTPKRRARRDRRPGSRQPCGRPLWRGPPGFGSGCLLDKLIGSHQAVASDAVASSASSVTATAWTTEAILSASWTWSLPTPSSRSARS